MWPLKGKSLPTHRPIYWEILIIFVLLYNSICRTTQVLYIYVCIYSIYSPDIYITYIYIYIMYVYILWSLVYPLKSCENHEKQNRRRGEDVSWIIPCLQYTHNDWLLLTSAARRKYFLAAALPFPTSYYGISVWLQI